MRLYYYMKPFVRHLFLLWKRPLPCPTILKLCTSIILIILIFLPFIYLCSVILFYYTITQYYLQKLVFEISFKSFIPSQMFNSHSIYFTYTFNRIFELEYPYYMNFLNYWNHVFYDTILDERYTFILAIYMERWCHLITAITSLIDYTRLFVCIMTS